MARSSEPSVRVAQLKARLSHYLRTVRRGHSVLVCDRDTPIARLVPLEPAPSELPARTPTRAFREIPQPAPLRRRLNSLAALREERQSER